MLVLDSIKHIMLLLLFAFRAWVHLEVKQYEPGNFPLADWTNMALLDTFLEDSVIVLTIIGLWIYVEKTGPLLTTILTPNVYQLANLSSDFLYAPQTSHNIKFLEMTSIKDCDRPLRACTLVILLLKQKTLVLHARSIIGQNPGRKVQSYRDTLRNTKHRKKANIRIKRNTYCRNECISNEK